MIRKGFYWYAIVALSGREDKAKRDLESALQKSTVADSYKKIIVPKEVVVSEDARGNRKEKERTIMPGYVFMLMDASRSLSVVAGVPGIYGFGPGATDLVPLTPDEVARFLGDSVGKRQVDVGNEYDEGDEVRIISGPMSDFTGRIESINKGKKTVKVLIDIFGQSTPTEVGFESVRKA